MSKDRNCNNLSYDNVVKLPLCSKMQFSLLFILGFYGFYVFYTHTIFFFSYSKTFCLTIVSLICLWVLHSILYLFLFFILCTSCTSGCIVSCQQLLTWDWPHAFMDASQCLYCCCVLALYIGQDQTFNVFTRKFGGNVFFSWVSFPFVIRQGQMEPFSASVLCFIAFRKLHLCICYLL